MDAAAKLGIDNPYSIVAPFYGFYLEKGSMTASLLLGKTGTLAC